MSTFLGNTSANVRSSPRRAGIIKNGLFYIIQDGDKVSHELNIGEMSCIEYSSMMGYDKMLKVLLQHSVNIETLRHYFSLGKYIYTSVTLPKQGDQQ